MALIYQADLDPDKLEMAQLFLRGRPGATPAGELHQVASYRLDDADGEVGLEVLLVARAGSLGELWQVPFVYRGAPSEEAERFLVGTMQHSVLGQRWVYDAAGDPFGARALLRATTGSQPQAPLKVVAEDGSTVNEEPTARIRAIGTEPMHPSRGEDADPEVLEEETCVVIDVDGRRLRLARLLIGPAVVELPGAARLEVSWSGGVAVAASVE